MQLSALRRKAILVMFIVIVLVFLLLFLKFLKQRRLQIVQAPHPLLHSVARPIDPLAQEARQIADELLQKAHQLDLRLNIFGLGLAGPQIGYDKRVILLKRSYGDYQIMLNPSITEQQWRMPWISTCLSLKGLHVLPRFLWIRVHYYGLDGNEHEEILRGTKAALMQQEVDHLDGILVSDYWL